MKRTKDVGVGDTLACGARCMKRRRVGGGVGDTLACGAWNAASYAFFSKATFNSLITNPPLSTLLV